MLACCSQIEAAAAIWRGCRGDEPSSVHMGASSIEPRLWSFPTRQYADEKVCSQVRRRTTRLSTLDSPWRTVSAQLPCPEVIGTFHFQSISPFKWGWWDKRLFLISSTHVIGIIQRPDLMLGRTFWEDASLICLLSDYSASLVSCLIPCVNNCHPSTHTRLFSITSCAFEPSRMICSVFLPPTSFSPVALFFCVSPRVLVTKEATLP